MSLKELYADNGANGDNVRYVVTGLTVYQRGWNPFYCVAGWPHTVLLTESPTTCTRCGARREQPWGRRQRLDNSRPTAIRCSHQVDPRRFV